MPVLGSFYKMFSITVIPPFDEGLWNPLGLKNLPHVEHFPDEEAKEKAIKLYTRLKYKIIS